MMRFSIALCFLYLLGIAPIGHAQPQAKPKNIEVEWAELKPTPDPTGVFEEVNTYAIVPKYLNQFPNGTHLRKAFILEKKEYIFGEPIMVEQRTWLDGLGEWKEGDFYGDSQDFIFLMRHEDGKWVLPLGLIREEIERMGSFVSVTKNTPHHRWVLLQRTLNTKRPGKYTVYCLFRNINWQGDAGSTYFNNGPPLPLYAFFPKEIRDYHASIDATMNSLGKKREDSIKLFYYWRIKSTLRRAEVFAQFYVTIREGTKAETEEMVRSTIESLGNGERSERLKPNLSLIQQDYFLPSLSMVYKENINNGNYVRGLLNHPSPEAVEILFQLNDGKVMNNFYTSTAHGQLVENVEYISMQGDEPLRTQAKEWLAKREAHFRQENEDASVLE